jgi:hypothetical protein
LQAQKRAKKGAKQSCNNLQKIGKAGKMRLCKFLQDRKTRQKGPQFLAEKGRNNLQKIPKTALLMTFSPIGESAKPPFDDLRSDRRKRPGTPKTGENRPKSAKTRAD